MKKRDLEELYKERFKNFQETPDERVWKNIEASLDKKKKKRIVPIWWQLGGVAALLAIMFYIFNPFDTEIDSDSTPISGTENNNDGISNQETLDKQDELNTISDQETIQVVDSENTTLEEDNEGKQNQNSATIEEKAYDNPVRQSSEISVAQKDQPKENNQTLKGVKQGKLFTPSNKSNEAIADIDTPSNKEIQEKNNESPTSFVKETISENKEGAIAQTGVDTTSEEVKVAENETQSPLNEINSEKEAVAKTDAIEEVKEIEKKSIFEAIKEQEENAVSENNKGKWSLGPSVAPVYFNSIGEGSPIHSNFASNSKSGNVNLSYGLTVAYDLGKRLTIRSGLHKVDFGYDTDDIVFSSSLTSSTNGEIDNINYNQNSRNLVVQSRAAGTENAAPVEQSSADLFARAPEFEGRMVQQLGYLELPVELNYALLDKKFGINLIGGVSSLFLVDNAVSLESNGLVTEMGEANNVNDVNFSTNLGVGFNYEFSPSIRVNLEPVFKYQLNTFSDTAGNFRPYSVGVYSGVSFKF